MSKKNLLHIVLSIVLYIIFLSLWYCILTLFSVLHFEGALSAITDAFGKISFYIWIIFGLTSFLSIIWLRLFVKSKWKFHTIAYCLTFAFAVSGILLINTGENKFSKFTPENWKEYPARRINMYFDLRERNILENIPSTEAVNILSAPNSTYTPEDTKSYDTIYIYDDGYGNSVYVYLKNGNVVNLECVT